MQIDSCIKPLSYCKPGMLKVLNSVPLRSYNCDPGVIETCF